MAVKLTDETSIVITMADLCAILTENFCGNYDAFGKLAVSKVTESDIADEFRVDFTPAPEKEV